MTFGVSSVVVDLAKASPLNAYIFITKVITIQKYFFPLYLSV